MHWFVFLLSVLPPLLPSLPPLLFLPSLSPPSFSFSSFLLFLLLPSLSLPSFSPLPSHFLLTFASVGVQGQQVTFCFWHPCLRHCRLFSFRLLYFNNIINPQKYQHFTISHWPHTAAIKVIGKATISGTSYFQHKVCGPWRPLTYAHAYHMYTYTYTHFHIHICISSWSSHSHTFLIFGLWVCLFVRV